MSTKRFKELKNLSKDELATKIRESEVELFQTKMKQPPVSSLIPRVSGESAKTSPG